jgi:hypothetical protein
MEAVDPDPVMSGRVCVHAVNDRGACVVQASIGEMSCNPSIGGLAKGTLVREVDVRAHTAPRMGVLGAISSHVADALTPYGCRRWEG